MGSASSSDLPIKHKIKSEDNDLTKKIKLEAVDITEPRETQVVKSRSGVKDRTEDGDTREDARNGEDDYSGDSRTDPSSSIKVSTSWSHLLQKPPRLGLSRLERKVNILHEVTILEAEE